MFLFSTIGVPSLWAITEESETKVDLIAAPTVLLSYNKDSSGRYQFQGPPPGIYINLNIQSLIFERDFLKSDPSFYYIGIGYLIDHTIQYGASITLGKYELIPTTGIGYNIGRIPAPWRQLYIPISIRTILYKSTNLKVAIWGQLQNYFWTNGIYDYYIGGKIASDIYVNVNENLEIAFQPVFGMGGSQILFGLRAGIVLSF